jgi:pimeloyl-ACP methyl ester carboxylesterase
MPANRRTRWWVFIGVVFFLLAGLVSYVMFELVILQPPVVEANFFERKRSERFKEPLIAADVAVYPQQRLGQGVLVHAAGAGRTVLLLPDSGTGPWLYQNLLATLAPSYNLYALGYRGMAGAAQAQSASLADYLEDATAALKAIKTDKVVLLGQGLGALLALKLALAMPERTEALVLLAPVTPRERSAQNTWLAKLVGGWIYDGVYQDPTSQKNFWLANFPSGFTQQNDNKPGFLAGRYLDLASGKVPWEYRAVVDEVVLGPLPWLERAYQQLGQQKFPVLQVIARYDVQNPLAAQERLSQQLEQQRPAGFTYGILNSGHSISLDWKWPVLVGALDDYLRDLKLDAPLRESEEMVDPAQGR